MFTIQHETPFDAALREPRSAAITSTLRPVSPAIWPCSRLSNASGHFR